MSVVEVQRSDTSIGRTSKRVFRWQVSGLVILLLTAAIVYIWGVDRNGWANAYYSAAVQAGQHDLQALFFGSADWGNSTTVDKPPLNLWLMGLSVHIFGLNPWSIMVPQAAVTVLSTFLVFRLMQRRVSYWPAMLAATVFAFTPITVLLARYNNPDPLMVCLMIAALYAGIRATENGSAKFLFLTSLLLSLGFLTKQLQAFLVLPAIVLTFALFAERKLWKRLKTVVSAGAVLVATSLAWPVLVDLTPPARRPYIGGSTTNSMLELTLGYNGVSRILHEPEAPSTALIPEQFRTVDSDAGLFRLFNSNYGQEIGWVLLPSLACCLIFVLKLLQRRYSRQQSIIVCASVAWMLTTYGVLSFMGNSFHSYYTSALALPMALCLGLGLDALNRNRSSLPGRLWVAVILTVSFIFSRAMWQLSDVFPEWLGSLAFFLGLGTAAALSLPAPKAWVARLATGLAALSLLIGPAYCSALALTQVQEGSNPLSGGLTRSPNTLSRFLSSVHHNNPAWAAGIALGFEPPPHLADTLRNAPANCTWAAATYPGQTAARYQLAIDRPVIAVGGFAATDPSPTLAQFKERVTQGDICYLVEQPQQLAVPGNGTELTDIQQWVTDTYESEEIDGITVYDLTS